MPKPFLVEQQWYYLTHNYEDNRVHAFLNGISQKVNLIARLEFKLSYFKTAVQHFSPNATETTPEQY